MSIEMRLEEQEARDATLVASNNEWLARIDPPVLDNEPILWMRPPWLQIWIIGGILLWLLIFWLVGIL